MKEAAARATQCRGVWVQYLKPLGHPSAEARSSKVAPGGAERIGGAPVAVDVAEQEGAIRPRHARSPFHHPGVGRVHLGRIAD
jgi:hypothetical protein